MLESRLLNNRHTFPSPRSQREVPMLRFLGPGARLCDGRTRREILRVGGLGLLGAGLRLPDLADAATDPGDSSFGRAKSCIVLFLMGGPPQQSTWDPKPNAPTEIRGEFGPIDSIVPGLQVCELLPRMSQLMNRVAVLRAMSSA